MEASRPVFGLPGWSGSTVQVTAAGLCRTLTGFPDSPVALARSGHLVAVGLTIASASVTRRLPSHITVVGLGADGWSGLAPASRERVLAAEVVVGSPRQLGLLPDVEGQSRRPWPRPLLSGIDDLLASYADRPILVLASGDPLVSGIGGSLLGRVPSDRLEVLPAVSSVSLALARMRWTAAEVPVVTVVGRRLETVLRELAPGRRVLVLSSDATTPGLLAGLLVEAGYGASVMTVLGDLDAPTETRLSARAQDWPPPDGPVPALHVLALELRGPIVGSWAAGLPDDAYDHDGQLTKRDLRASALARLAPQPGEVLWDLGAGAGSVGIEWMRAHPTCLTWAVEADEGRADRIAANARRLGVPDLMVVRGRAADVLDELPWPHAVFVGGGATSDGLLDRCREALRAGGRLVVHGVTLETEGLLAAAYAEHGGELARISVETAAPIGSFTGWTPARAVTQWTWTRP